MANSQKNVDLVIRARDESQRALNSAKTALDRFTAAQARTAARRNVLAEQEKTARGAGAAYLEAAEAAEALGRKLAAAKRPSAALKTEFDQARLSARAAKQEFMAALTVGARSRGKTGTPSSFAAFDNGITARAGAEHAAVATNRLADAIARVAAYKQRVARFAAFDAVASGATRAEAGIESLTNATTRNTVAAGANAAAVRAQGNAMGLAGRQAAAWSSRSGRGFLGLRPYELQNLGYQLNDVFTQIASGTPVMQVAAQQGGQFAQLFPKVLVGALRLAPVLALATAALSPFITALMRSNNEAKSLKEFDLLLTRSGNAANYTAPKLAAVAHALDLYSGSLKDARTALTEFVGDAVAPEYLERFGKAALDLSKVMDIEVAEAAKKVSDAFTGNADAILALDDELGFLTKSEREHAETLRKQQRDAELRTQAFAKFEQKYGETAAKMKGPWSQILADFGAAWSAFVDAVNFIDFGAARRQIDGLLSRIQRLTAMLPGANKSGLDNMRATRQRNFEEIEGIEDAHAAARARGTLGQGGDAARIRQQERRLALLRRENEELDIRIALESARQPGGLLAPVTPGDTTTRPPDNAYEPPKGKTDAERLAEQRAAFLASLQQESVARQFQLSLVSQTERESRILQEIEQARVRAAELGLTLSAEQLALIRQETGAIYDAEAAARALKMIDQARLELAEARGEIESQDDFVERKLREANLYTQILDEATGELVNTIAKGGVEYAEILRNLYQINEVTRQRVAAEKQVTDLTALRADLMEQIQFYEDAGQQATADLLREQLVGVNAELATAVDHAINFWTAMGGEGADAALLRLGQLRDQLAGIGENAIVSGRQINEMLAGGGVDAFNQFFDALGEGVNVISALRDAFLQFAADFLREIANMILKQMLLNALQQGGGPGGGVGGTIASAINGLFRHNGGLVSQGGGYRPVPLAAFAGATRYHTGGIAGLKPDEVPSILKRGEEVLTARDPRHRANGGGQQRGGAVKIVNVFDPAEALERGLASEAGERVFMNFVRRNSGAFKAALG